MLPARDPESGAILVSVMVLSLVLGVMALTDMTLLRDSWADSGRKQDSQQALYDAYAELAKAQAVIANSDYLLGQNRVLSEALDTGTIDGTSVEVQQLIPDSAWYLLTSRMTFEEGERVVEQLVRDIDSLASYNLFVTEHPVGISGSPVGTIHTNRDVQFYFPDGVYRATVTAVEGHTFKSGASDGNTSLLGVFDSYSDYVDLEKAANASASLASLGTKANAEFNFGPDKEVGLSFYQVGDEQWVQVNLYQPPYIENYTVTKSKKVHVGGHWEYYTVKEPVYVDDTRIVDKPIYKYETATRTVDVMGEVEKTREVPVYGYVDRVKTVPIYEDQPRTKMVPIYENQPRTKLVIKDVFVPISGGDGGAAVGGDSGTLGYWTKQEVAETYYEKVKVGEKEETYYESVKVGEEPQTYQSYEQVGTKTETYYVSEPVGTKEETYEKKVFSHYEQVLEPYKRLSHYVDVEKKKWKKDYEKEYYDVAKQTKHKRSLLSSEDLKAPDNGIIYSEAPIHFVKGDIVGRLTVASEQGVRITDNIQYVDGEGDRAFVNGLDPSKPYEPNTSYDNNATLGIIAREDIIYSRDVPFNFEINASMLSMEGRVGIEGIELDDDGKVTGFNQMKNQWGEPTSGEFLKNSIRRLGGVVTAKRPLDTVVSGGAMKAGFGVGTSVFDENLFNQPPPDFLTQEVPRFFALNVEK